MKPNLQCTALLLAAAGAPALPSVGWSAIHNSHQDAVDHTRNVIKELVATRTKISEVREAWRVEQQFLEDEKAMLLAELEDLESVIGETKGRIGTASEELEKLQASQSDLADVTEDFEIEIVGLEVNLGDLLTRLPQTALDEVDVFVRTLPEDPQNTEVQTSLRYGSVIGVLTGLTKFNRTIHVVDEMREIDEHTRFAVKTLYVGLGQAYYVSPNGDRSGYGTIGDQGWVWEPRDESEFAAAVTKAIAIQENQEAAAFVRLPLQVRDSGRQY